MIPNVVGVAVPASGCSSFSAFVSIRQTRPGEAKQAIPIVFGVDHYIKCVIVVDDDIDVRNEAEVLWAVAEHAAQASRDLVVLTGMLGAILDPSPRRMGSLISLE